MNKFIIVFTIICIYISIFSTISYAGFNDISGHWCEAEINDFYESGYVVGYSDDKFRPDNEITRAEFCKIINSYMGFETSGEWQSENMNVARSKGYLVTGESTETISREEAFVAIAKVMKLDNIEYELNFIDSGEISVWAVPAVKSLTFMEYIEGYENSELRPKNNITRAEVVKVLYEFVGVGGVDEEIEELRFMIGYLKTSKFGIEFVEIAEELEIQSGDVYTLGAIVSDNEDPKFEIVSGEEFVEFDPETLIIEGIAGGEAILAAESTNERKEIIIKVK